MFRAIRYHDISCGHRVHGHEGKCRHLHGHNYRIHFHCKAEEGLDSVGRVIDFSVIKETLCMWVENNWDHKFLVWGNDPEMQTLRAIDDVILKESFVLVPFNPTAEKMAEFLVKSIAPVQLHGTGVALETCVVEETRKCSAAFSL